jgi:hypothetical protein
MCIVGEYTGTPIDTIIESRIVPVCQWYFETKQHAKPDSNLLKAGWAALEKRYRESIPACITLGEAQGGKNNVIAEWITPIQEAEFDHLRYIALRSSSALEEEGRIMHHCIATYSDRCKSSSLRAFSVRSQNTDERIATLTVFYSSQSRSWQLDQIHGPSNSEVAEHVIASSLALLYCLDEATSSDMGLEKEMSQFGRFREINRRQFFDDDCCLTF